MRFLPAVLVLWALPTALLFGGDPGTISLKNGALRLELDLQGRCVISEAWVHGRRVSTPGAAAFSGVMVSNTWFTSCSNQPGLRIKTGPETARISGIKFGPGTFEVEEEWSFAPGGTRERPALIWRIQRRYPSAATIQDSVFPAWSFATMKTWTGALLDNGGVAWNRYLDTTGATYAVKAGAFVSWNPEANSALAISAKATGPGKAAAVAHARFTHERDGSQTSVFSFTGSELRPRHDLRRFHPGGADVWAPFQASAGTVSVTLEIASLDYEAAYDLGEFRGISEDSVREMLHTIGRYGVIDRRIAGANGWRSGFKCLHEQWFSQMGIALQDPDYVQNCAATFDYERDHALLEDGRLKSRWWWVAGDAMPGTYDKLGYYEAQWGMLLDSQTCFPICVAELFDLTGDQAWLRSHKTGCERMLDYLLRRDADGDGLVEMLNGSHTEGKGSDWIDVIWAAHENALVNAELYYALNRWSELEELLGDRAQATRFAEFAARLKRSFNRSTAEGGFWDPGKNWYVYWRDKDDSIHGNNLVTPVNFAAIAYGLCDAPDRRNAILERVEVEMRKENLFYWPLSFFPYEPGEGHPTVNYPFPKYENGDIFLSWGELAVRAYAQARPEIALGYIRNTLRQYERDGLSFQRYERRSQAGAGDDILAGNIMPVVGLYRNIYGIQPKHNRLFMDPHLSAEVEGTRLLYRLRGQTWRIELSSEGTRLEVDGFSLRHKGPFGMNAKKETLQFFARAAAEPSLQIERAGRTDLDVEVASWNEGEGNGREWLVTPARAARLLQTVSGLEPRTDYRLSLNGKEERGVRADSAGEVHVRTRISGQTRFVLAKP